MINFSKINNRTPEEKKLDDYNLCLRMAEMNYADLRGNPNGTRNYTANELIYYIFSHLQPITELGINLEEYERLQTWQPEVDIDALCAAKVKLNEARSVIKKLRKQHNSFVS